MNEQYNLQHNKQNNGIYQIFRRKFLLICKCHNLKDDINKMHCMIDNIIEIFIEDGWFPSMHRLANTQNIFYDSQINIQSITLKWLHNENYIPFTYSNKFYRLLYRNRFSIQNLFYYILIFI